jgi:hypothetical protein
MVPSHHPSPPMAMGMHRGPLPVPQPGPPQPGGPPAGSFLAIEALAALNEEVWLRLGKCSTRGP